MTGSYLCGVPLGPVVWQQVGITNISRAGFLLKVLPELLGVEDLEDRPGRSQKVRDGHRNNVWDRLVQEGDHGHTHHPDLEGHKRDVFTLVVMNSAPA